MEEKSEASTDHVSVNANCVGGLFDSPDPGASQRSPSDCDQSCSDAVVCGHVRVRHAAGSVWVSAVADCRLL